MNNLLFQCVHDLHTRLQTLELRDNNQRMVSLGPRMPLVTARSGHANQGVQPPPDPDSPGVENVVFRTETEKVAKLSEYEHDIQHLKRLLKSGKRTRDQYLRIIASNKKALDELKPKLQDMKKNLQWVQGKAPDTRTAEQQKRIEDVERLVLDAEREITGLEHSNMNVNRDLRKTNLDIEKSNQKLQELENNVKKARLYPVYT